MLTIVTRVLRRWGRGRTSHNTPLNTPMAKGTVKWYSQKKGYGFIVQEDGTELFVHHSALGNQRLNDGATVEYVVGEGPKGPCAKDVKVIS